MFHVKPTRHVLHREQVTYLSHQDLIRRVHQEPNQSMMNNDTDNINIHYDTPCRRITYFLSTLFRSITASPPPELESLALQSSTPHINALRKSRLQRAGLLAISRPDVPFCSPITEQTCPTPRSSDLTPLKLVSRETNVE